VRIRHFSLPPAASRNPEPPSTIYADPGGARRKEKGWKLRGLRPLANARSTYVVEHVTALRDCPEKFKVVNATCALLHELVRGIRPYPRIGMLLRALHLPCMPAPVQPPFRERTSTECCSSPILQASPLAARDAPKKFPVETVTC